MDAKLVYDVAVHRGEDTAYYLHKGFRVVGVEANPSMADHLRKRFESEIASGRFTLLEVGVAESEGELDFWVCDDQTDWSSFNQQKAPSGGKTSRPVKVRTLPFAAVSVEMSLANGDRDLSLLRALGYCRFKIISQVTFCAPRSVLQRVFSRARGYHWRRLKRMERDAFGKQRDGDWQFTVGSSGTFGNRPARPMA